MRYIKPDYEIEFVVADDIILTSGGAILTEKDENSGQVSASVHDILGF
ncbi:MAG: hypothetical protein IJ039_02905 [Clostridia bacterium]|nr:hypothetical protein [Clostridia bacterium]